ncbi:MAG: hypothetical protein RMJ53_02045 [Chitinophagales bacterium]|nr:hypothetical protein [Chitinophagales bacterium]MDW8272991.1 hypothetical protein [Chitinophagales bacterium]
MKWHYCSLFVFVFSLTSVQFFAQGTYIPLGSDAYHIIDRLDIRYGRLLPIPHTSVKPYQRKTAAEIAETMLLSNLPFNKRQKFELQYLVDENSEWLDSLQSRTSWPLWKFYREPASLFHVNVKKDFSLKINPILAFRVAGESGNKEILFVNTRGLELRFNIRQRVGFYFFITENQTRPPRYVQRRITEFDYIPGNGYWKEFRRTGIDYFEPRGYIDVNVLRYISLQFGYDRHFIGNGFRSFYLSDFAAPFLFLKMNLKVWRFNYQTIWAELINQYKRGADRELPKKYAAFHHLNLNVAHFLDIGFFEGVIFNRRNHFELHYLNPVIFYRAIEQSLGSPDNALIGFDIKANAFNHLQVYSQFILDEFNLREIVQNKGWWANKFAWQLGAKYIDLVPNLDLQAEWNMARPFIYTHNLGDNVTANYTHYNQPLAHPLGANFYEFAAIGRYRILKNLQLSLKYIHSTYGEDSTDAASGLLTHFGGNILRNTTAETVRGVYENKIAQGARAKQNYFDIMLTYQPWHNIYVDAQFLYRNKDSKLNQRDEKTYYFGIGARMNIAYKQYEF